MPHNRVFISYSHYAEDQKLLEEFRVHLKPWEKTTLLDIWSDHEIKPGEDWHRKIQDALESIAVAILLVSPEFLASEYISQYELPYLLRACEKGDVKLVCLYLRHSSVAHDDAAIEVKLSSGETKCIKLTQYQ